MENMCTHCHVWNEKSSSHSQTPVTNQVDCSIFCARIKIVVKVFASFSSFILVVNVMKYDFYLKVHFDENYVAWEKKLLTLCNTRILWLCQRNVYRTLFLIIIFKLFSWYILLKKKKETTINIKRVAASAYNVDKKQRYFVWSTILFC